MIVLQEFVCMGHEAVDGVDVIGSNRSAIRKWVIRVMCAKEDVGVEVDEDGAVVRVCDLVEREVAHLIDCRSE